jgi:branched-chain amino acid transport system ATP-binding protein
MLRLDNVHSYYGDAHVLQGVSLQVSRGEVVALFGRNGAGKTTTMRAIMSLNRAAPGRITLDGAELSRLPPHRVARAGVGYVPSGRRVFSALTTRQCLSLAAGRQQGRRQRGGRQGHAADSSPPPGPGQPWTIDRVQGIFPRLAELADRRAGLLSGGEQQMLKLGQALLRNPRILLLDEPSEGLAPAVVAEMSQWITTLRDEGMSILIAEQNVRFTMAVIDRGYLLAKGRIRFEAAASELASSPELHEHLAMGTAQGKSE